MLRRVMLAPARALRMHISASRTIFTSASRFESLPTKQGAIPSVAQGGFVRPRTDGHGISAQVQTPIARATNPPGLVEYGLEQSPNFPDTWSESQRPKSEAMKGPRFEQTDYRFQPQPLSAMELISNHPIQMSDKRVVSCDGGKYWHMNLLTISGDGPLGHPRVYINLVCAFFIF